MRLFILKRINEENAAEKFYEQLFDGYYKYDRSVNTEVDYSAEKEQRDTNAVKEFINSDFFNSLLNMK